MRSNAIQKLREGVVEQVPGVTASIDAPDDPRGAWFLDLERAGHRITVEWRPEHEFGLTSSDRDGFGEGPEETYGKPKEALTRIVELLWTGAETRMPRRIGLRELRAELGHLTQAELAVRLGVQQAAVSKLESRRDTTIGTLHRAITAMGGQLEIRARFPDETVVISQFEDVS
jgi:hypothetical protein